MKSLVEMYAELDRYAIERDDFQGDREYKIIMKAIGELSDDAKITYRIRLRDTRFGFARWTKMHTDKAAGLVYWWSEGNFGCDCNRSNTLYDHDEYMKLDCNGGDNQIEITGFEIIEGAER